jgi:hypothetical protein
MTLLPCVYILFLPSKDYIFRRIYLGVQGTTNFTLVLIKLLRIYDITLIDHSIHSSASESGPITLYTHLHPKAARSSVQHLIY